MSIETLCNTGGMHLVHDRRSRQARADGCCLPAGYEIAGMTLMLFIGIRQGLEDLKMYIDNFKQYWRQHLAYHILVRLAGAGCCSPACYPMNVRGDKRWDVTWASGKGWSTYCGPR